MTYYLTEYFAEYLYGHHEMLYMKATQTGLYEAKPETRYCAISSTDAQAEVEAPNLGKNIFALKIFVPKKIKIGLSQRAALAAVTLGEFLRILICFKLFGCDYGHDKVTMIDKSSSNFKKACAWEQLGENLK